MLVSPPNNHAIRQQLTVARVDLGLIGWGRFGSILSVGRRRQSRVAGTIARRGLAGSEWRRTRPD